MNNRRHMSGLDSQTICFVWNFAFPTHLASKIG